MSKEATIEELTLEGLRGAIGARLAHADEKSEEQWKSLLSVVNDLAADAADQTLVDGRRWALERVKVDGFRGATSAVELRFDGGTALTVLHGPNGAGKSTIAEALRVAIHGEAGAKYISGSSRGASLWRSSDDRSGDSDAMVSVDLVDQRQSGTHLTIAAVYDGTTVSRVATLKTAKGTQQYDAEHEGWRAWDAMARSSPPVLAYADLADELQRSTDLLAWLTSCLAMSVATDTMNGEVVARKAAADNAKRDLDSARTLAQQRVQQADERAQADGVDTAPLMISETLSEREMAAWLQENELSRTEAGRYILPTDGRERVARYLARFEQLRDEWRNQDTGLLAPLVAASLAELSERVRDSRQDSNGGTCPVCGEISPTWRDHLAQEATRLANAQAASNALGGHLNHFEADVLGLLVEAQGVGSEVSELRSAAARLAPLLETARKATADPNRMSHKMLSALNSLLEWWNADGGSAFVAATCSKSDRRRHWQIERWEAISEYLDRWRELREGVLSRSHWTSTKAYWDRLLLELRNGRAQTLGELVGSSLEQMLEDQDLRLNLGNFAVSKTAVKLSIEDGKGKVVELSHLSAGQRNALLLGPVMARANNGLFGFCMLDDPVHAFDEFRIDRLARIVTELTKGQDLIVATHDGRLREHLEAHGPLSQQVVRISRSPEGKITLNPTSPPWLELLNLASAVVREAGESLTAEGCRRTLSLCRLAFDEAIEIAFLRVVATLDSDEKSEALRDLHAARTTQGRVSALEATASENLPWTTLIDEARKEYEPFIETWHDAVHGTLDTHDIDMLTSNVQACREACKHLRKVGVRK